MIGEQYTHSKTDARYTLLAVGVDCDNNRSGRRIALYRNTHEDGIIQRLMTRIAVHWLNRRAVYVRGLDDFEDRFKAL